MTVTARRTSVTVGSVEKRIHVVEETGGMIRDCLPGLTADQARGLAHKLIFLAAEADRETTEGT